MRDDDLKQKIEACVQEAAEYLRHENTEAAREELYQAQDLAAEIENNEERRFAWSALAKHMINAQFADMANLLAKKLIALDRKLGNTRYLVTDLLTYGSSLHLSGQHPDAAGIYQEALDLSVETKAWHNAAAASSNYAAALAAQGKLDEARSWLDTSLDYLKRESNADTEIRTYGMIISIMERQQESSENCFKLARWVLDTYEEKMQAAHRMILRRALDPALKRFFAENRDLAPEDWVSLNFPELMEDDHG